jgi:hypothetical protein
MAESAEVKEESVKAEGTVGPEATAVTMAAMAAARRRACWRERGVKGEVAAEPELVAVRTRRMAESAEVKEESVKAEGTVGPEATSVVEVHLVTADAKPVGRVEAGGKRSVTESAEVKTTTAETEMAASGRQRWRPWRPPRSPAKSSAEPAKAEAAAGPEETSVTVAATEADGQKKSRKGSGCC